MSIGIGVIALAADLFGVTSDPTAIGWKQVSAAGFGLIVVIPGIKPIRRARNKEE